MHTKPCGIYFVQSLVGYILYKALWDIFCDCSILFLAVHLYKQRVYMYLCINFDKLLIGHCAGKHFERVLLLFAAALDKQCPDVTKQLPYHDCSAISISHKYTNDIYVHT